MTWWTGAALGFDTETDGPAPTEARIITSGLVLMTPGNPPQVMPEVMLQPERDIPQGAIDVHGITTERATEEGTPRLLGLGQIVTTIAELASTAVPLVGHNVCYDLTLLDREMGRTGLGALEIESMSGMVLMVDTEGKVFGGPFPVLDTFVLDKALDTYRRGSRKLTAVAEHYGVPMEAGSAHGATADVIAALRICIAMANRGAWPAADVIDLHGAQIKWKAEQARGLRDYFASKGNKEAADSVSESWPFEPRGD